MQARLAPFDFYTIGYERLSLDELLSRLRAAGIRCLVDVRARPWSQVTEYTKAVLEERLYEYGRDHGYAIKYVSMPSLGNSYRDERWKEQYRSATLLKNDELEKLRCILVTCPVVLMCYEKDPGDCHRSILAEILRERYGLDYADLRSG